jgi:uncharacterized damage-inducible protein DinB
MLSINERWNAMPDGRSLAMNTQVLICLALTKNIEVNTALTTYLRPEMLVARTPHAGFTVAQHLVHLCNDVKHWSKHVASMRAELLPTLVMPSKRESFSSDWLDQAQRAWNGAERLVIELVSESVSGEKGDLPHVSIEMYAIHLLVHDSYHRGQMVAALKATGYSMPDSDTSLWSPWRS